MSDFIVSARKYRPATFRDVVGQEALTTTLKNAISQGKLSHAYLFCGPRGVGKTSCARIFAKTINCEHRAADGEACNECESCRAANEQRSYNIFELDAASNNSVDDIRQLIEQVYVAPTSGKYRVYIIDEVHMLSSSAFNAFLKTLEEPPAHAIFILATTEKNKVLPTIISRCQVHDFNRITSNDIARHLSYVAAEEGVEAEDDALQMIAISADGGMRDALSMFDQIAGYGNGKITTGGVRANLNLLDDSDYFALLAYIYQGQHTQMLTLVDSLTRRGYECGVIIRGFSAFLRNVILSQNDQTVPLIEAPGAIRDRLIKAGRYIPPHLVWDYLKISTAFGAQYRDNSERRLALEVALLKMAEKSPDSPLHSPTATDAPQRGGGSLSQQSTGVSASINQRAVGSSSSEVSTQRQTPHASTSVSEPQQGYRATPPTTNEISGIVTARPVTKPKVQTKERYGFSLDESQESQELEPSETQKKRSQPFDQEQLMTAWMNYRGKQSDPFLRAVMRDHVPTLGEGFVLQMELTSQTEASQIEIKLEDLMRELADELQNDLIRLNVSIVSAPVSHLPKTPRDILSFFEEQNEDFKKLVSELNLHPTL